MTELEADLLVAGSGAAGLTAALVAAKSGQRVIVVEKSPQWGGASATSGGFLWIPDSHLAALQGADDSPEDAYNYLRHVTDAVVTDASIRAFIRGGRQMLEWLERQSEVRYRSIAYTDYRPTVPGARLGFRTHDVLPMDGRRLGDGLETLRPSAPAALLFNRIAFTMDDVFPLLHRPPGWRRVLLKVLARYYLDVGQRLKSPRNRFLAAGNALLGRLRVSLDGHDVQLWLRSPLRELVREPGGGRVIAGIVDRAGERVRVSTRLGVVLATGGFEADPELRRRYLPGAWEPRCSGSIESNTGDGVLVAQGVGAALGNMDSAWWGPMLTLPDETRSRLLTFERALPGCIIVNRAGRRFMNEAMAYDLAGRRMVEADVPGGGTQPSWFLFDERYRRRYPVGPLIPRVPLLFHQRGLRDILVRANSWAGLAARTGLPAPVLKETLDEFNRHAASGHDPLYGRGSSAYDRFYGDPKVHPNPNLAPLATPPFYAIPIQAGDIGTNGGVRTNEHAQVLDERARPIAGLYATGNTTASVMGHSYPGAGATLGPAMTFGYIAAQHACGRALAG